MIDLAHLGGRIIAVLGLGTSGLASVRALVQAGAIVWAWDDDALARDQLGTFGLVPVNLAGCDWHVSDMLVISPGIPSGLSHPHIVAGQARSANKPVICDIELLGTALPEVPTLAITGTNGKSTTTSLTAHILKAAGIRAQAGGNLGIPALALEPADEEGCFVMELSSYQLELLKQIAFDACALLNITADHLDHHGGMEGYVKAKRLIFDHSKGSKWAIISVDDEYCVQIAHQLIRQASHHVIEVSVRNKVPKGIYVEENWLVDDTRHIQEPVLDLTTADHMPGLHNWQNIAFAYALCRSRAVDISSIIKGIMSFPCLAHRQEYLGEIDNVRFINDSKATNMQASAQALAAYENIYWIVGGRAKPEGIDGLEKFYDRISKAYLIGESSPAFAGKFDGALVYEPCDKLEIATETAFAQARKSGVDHATILLSPACASFDQFRNFEERGDCFRAAFERLNAVNRSKR